VTIVVVIEVAAVEVEVT
jgi:hypothetical protein